MSAIPLIIQRLLADPAVAEKVGDRVYAIAAPARSLPADPLGPQLPDCIVIQTGESEDYTLAHETVGLPEARINIICRGVTATEAITLGDAILAALKTVGNADSSIDGLTIFREPIDMSDYTDDGKAFRRVIGFRARYRE